MREVIVTPPAIEPVSMSDVMSYCRIDESNQEPAPSAPSVAIGSGSGNVDNGVHRYAITFVTAEGETQAGGVSAPITIADKTTTGKVSLTGIQVGGSNVLSRKIYRTSAGGSTYMFLATIADNTTTIFTDNVADSSLGAQAPAINTTVDRLLTILIASARFTAENLLKRYLITQTVDVYLDGFSNDTILPRYQSITSITYTNSSGNTTTLSTDYYSVDASNTGRLILNNGYQWPETLDQENSVKIRLVVGYGSNQSDIPECVRHWMLMRIKQAYDNRDAVSVTNTIEFPYSYVDGLLDSERVWGR